MKNEIQRHPIVDRIRENRRLINSNSLSILAISTKDTYELEEQDYIKKLKNCISNCTNAFLDWEMTLYFSLRLETARKCASAKYWLKLADAIKIEISRDMPLFSIIGGCKDSIIEQPIRIHFFIKEYYLGILRLLHNMIAMNVRISNLRRAVELWKATYNLYQSLDVGIDKPDFIHVEVKLYLLMARILTSAELHNHSIRFYFGAMNLALIEYNTRTVQIEHRIGIPKNFVKRKKSARLMLLSLCCLSQIYYSLGDFEKGFNCSTFAEELSDLLLDNSDQMLRFPQGLLNFYTAHNVEIRKRIELRTIAEFLYRKNFLSAYQEIEGNLDKKSTYLSYISSLPTKRPDFIDNLHRYIEKREFNLYISALDNKLYSAEQIQRNFSYTRSISFKEADSDKFPLNQTSTGYNTMGTTYTKSKVSKIQNSKQIRSKAEEVNQRINPSRNKTLKNVLQHSELRKMLTKRQSNKGSTTEISPLSKGHFDKKINNLFHRSINKAKSIDEIPKSSIRDHRVDRSFCLYQRQENKKKKLNSKSINQTGIDQKLGHFVISSLEDDRIPDVREIRIIHSDPKQQLLERSKNQRMARSLRMRQRNTSYSIDTSQSTSELKWDQDLSIYDHPSFLERLYSSTIRIKTENTELSEKIAAYREENFRCLQKYRNSAEFLKASEELSPHHKFIEILFKNPHIFNLKHFKAKRKIMMVFKVIMDHEEKLKKLAISREQKKPIEQVYFSVKTEIKKAILLLNKEEQELDKEVAELNRKKRGITCPSKDKKKVVRLEGTGELISSIQKYMTRSTVCSVDTPPKKVEIKRHRIIRRLI